MGIGMARYEAGQIIRFTYGGEGTDPADRYKEVLVLHPNWRGKMHAFDLKRMTAAQRQVLVEVFDEESYKPGHRSQIMLVEDIKRRMNVIEEVKNPMSFYQKFVRPFLLTAGDCYRTYYPEAMSGVQVVKETNVHGGVYNPRPLFHK